MLSITDTVSTCLWVHRKGDYVIDSCWVRLRVNFTVARMGLSLRLKNTVLHVLTRMLICPHCKKKSKKIPHVHRAGKKVSASAVVPLLKLLL